MKHKKRKTRTATEKEYILSQKKSLTVGALFVAVIVLMLLGTLLKPNNHLPLKTKPITQAIPTISQENSSLSPSAMTIQNSKNNYYLVKKGDSFAKIGNNVCSDPRAWIYIEEDNNINQYVSLQPGDVILLNCR